MKMQDYTKIQIYLKNHYRGFQKIDSIKKFDHNNINSINYLIESKNKKLVLRNFIDGSKPQKVEKICKILDFCTKRGVKISEPIKNKKNKFVDPKRNFYLTKFYNGSFYNGNKYQLSNLAKNLAYLHTALQENKIKYNYRTNQRFYRIISENELLKIKKIILKKNNTNKFEKTALKQIGNLVNLSENVNINSKKLSLLKLKKQLIHDDLHPKNVIFHKNKVVAILDFHSMRKNPKMEDIAFTSFRFATLKSCAPKKITNLIVTFIETYRRYNEINEDELNQYDYFLTQKFLGRLSYILRKYFFYDSDLWIQDFDKNIKYLYLVNKISYKLKDKFD